LKKIEAIKTAQLTFNLLSRKQRNRLRFLTVTQSALSLLDLLGVVLLGVLGSLTISGVQSRNPSSQVGSVLRLLGIEDLDFQKQSIVLGVIAASFLISKTIMSAFLSRKTALFMGTVAAEVTTSKFSAYLFQSFENMSRFSTHQVLYGLTWGVSTLMLGVLGTLSVLIADVILFIVLVSSLFVVNPLVGALTTVIFSSVGLGMYFGLRSSARSLGVQETSLSVESNALITEALESYREAFVGNYRESYVTKLAEIRSDLARVISQNSFIPSLNKYVIETTLVLSALIISAIQFTIYDAIQAVAGIAIVIASGSRIAPAVLRIQQGALILKGSIGASTQTFQIIDAIQENGQTHIKMTTSPISTEDFSPSVELVAMNFSYQNSDQPVISNLNLQVNPGEHLAIVGNSGSGKSTLADLILGILKPTSGTVRLGGQLPADAITQWPGQISYVPQSPRLIRGSIRENLLKGLEPQRYTDNELMRALELACLQNEVNSFSQGLDTRLGTGGQNLSGGQVQRLALARAFITNPKLVILDEPTSGLDGGTEAAISEMIYKTKNKVTIILIAHRLSSIRNFPRIALMQDGAFAAIGTFDELKLTSEHFRKVAHGMGL
jgi:ABC-type multidrug transport system fused ATPase/permease subunit